MPLYPTVESALIIVKQQLDISSEDLTQDELLTAWLEAAKGCIKSTSIDAYRPFIVAARFLSIQPPREGIIAASGTDGVQWLDPYKIVKALLDMQRNLDKTLGCISEDWSTIESDRPLHTFAAFTV